MRGLQINQTIENTYITKITAFDKPIHGNELEDYHYNSNLNGANVSSSNSFNNEISFTLFAEELYLIKKFLDVIINFFKLSKILDLFG